MQYKRAYYEDFWLRVSNRPIKMRTSLTDVPNDIQRNSEHDCVISDEIDNGVFQLSKPNWRVWILFSRVTRDFLTVVNGSYLTHLVSRWYVYSSCNILDEVNARVILKSLEFVVYVFLCDVYGDNICLLLIMIGIQNRKCTVDIKLLSMIKSSPPYMRLPFNVHVC